MSVAVEETLLVRETALMIVLLRKFSRRVIAVTVARVDAEQRPRPVVYCIKRPRQLSVNADNSFARVNLLQVLPRYGLYSAS